MDRVFSARVFTLMYGIGYAIAVGTGHPLFRYYPQQNRFSSHALAGQSPGPAMSWYGWIATAATLALLSAALVPKRLGDRIPGMLILIVPLIMLLAGLRNEWVWFS
jgi:MFS superfamily sulfate permease-like transporter